MNIVGYGGGAQTAPPCWGLWQHHVPVDLILFADPGGEQPHTYHYLRIMDQWLREHGMPGITRGVVHRPSGTEADAGTGSACVPLLFRLSRMAGRSVLSNTKWLPRRNSAPTTHRVQNAWARGENVVKMIGYDAGEEKRRLRALPHDLTDRKYQKAYPLMEWGWDRNRCIQEIQNAGLPLPGKSSCFSAPR